MHRSTVLPEEFQGDFVAIDGRRDVISRIARKGEKVRWDFEMYSNFGHQTLLRNEGFYSIDRSSKSYSAIPSMYEGEDRDEFERLFGDLSPEAVFFFRERDLDQLTFVSNDGSSSVYQQGKAGSLDMQVVTVDNASGMVTAIEFPARKGQTEHGSLLEYRFEIRNLQFKVDDQVFEIPAGYTNNDQLPGIWPHSKNEKNAP